VNLEAIATWSTRPNGGARAADRRRAVTLIKKIGRGTAAQSEPCLLFRAARIARFGGGQALVPSSTSGRLRRKYSRSIRPWSDTEMKRRR